MISSSPEILVQLYSAPSQVMHNSYAELDVEVRFTEATDYRAQNGRCDFTIDGSKRRHGLIYSPRHTIPRNTTCSFRLQGASSHDRIWLYFLSYFVEDKHPWSRRETCEVGKLEIYEPGGSRKRDAAALLVTGDIDEETGERIIIDRKSDEPSYRFCEKTFPKVCARAADNPDYVPVRPCKVPDESYLSRGPGLIIKHNVYTTPELSTWSSSFTLRYEFVDMRQHGIPIPADSQTLCDRRFDSRTNHIGTVNSPKNVFFFGRGGSQNISCSYEFMGLPSERVVLTFTDIRLRSTNCEHHYDPMVQRHTCRLVKTMTTGTAVIAVVERTIGNVQSPLACFCNLKSEPRRPLVIESVTNNVKITFTVTEMSPFDDFNDFGFEAVYEFLPISLCEANIRRKNGSSEGEVSRFFII